MGLHCEISLLEHPRPNLEVETNNLTSSLPSDKYDVTLTDTHIPIRAKILSDVSVLLTWSLKNPSSFSSSLTLISLTGPWSKDNLVTAAEFFFQRNAYHPFAQCNHPHKHSDSVPLTKILQKSAGMATADRKMLHYFQHHVRAGLDPDYFRSDRKAEGKKVKQQNRFKDRIFVIQQR